MTGAELKTLRESLGLNAQWLVKNAGMVLRSVQYLESKNKPVFPDVEALILSVEDFVKSEADRLMVQLTGLETTAILYRFRQDRDLQLFLPGWRGKPSTCHAAMVAEVRRRRSNLFLPTEVIWFDPDNYFAWLATEPQSESSMLKWASEAFKSGESSDD